MLTHTPDGSPKTLPLECGECDACREWRKRTIAIRFGLGRESDTITLLRVSNFQANDYDAAAKWADGMGRRQPGKRWRGCGKARITTPKSSWLTRSPLMGTFWSWPSWTAPASR